MPLRNGMTRDIEIAKECGITYYLTPENTCEMHGTDRQIAAFAAVIREEVRKECALVAEETGVGPGAEAVEESIRLRKALKPFAEINLLERHTPTDFAMHVLRARSALWPNAN